MKITDKYQPLYQFLNEHPEIDPDNFKKHIKSNKDSLLKNKEIVIDEINTIRIWYINKNFNLKNYK